MDIKTLVAQIREGTADPEDVAKSFSELPSEVQESLDLSPDRFRGGEVQTDAGIYVAVGSYNPNGLKRLSIWSEDGS